MRKIDRFLQYLDYKGISENKATVDCELSKGLIGQAKSGKSDLGNKATEKVLSFYQDLSRVWLLTGTGSMLNSSEESTQPENPMTDEPKQDSLVEYLKSEIKNLQSMISQLNEEKADLLRENAVLEYQIMMYAPKGERTAGNADGSLSADTV